MKTSKKHILSGLIGLAVCLAVFAVAVDRIEMAPAPRLAASMDAKAVTHGAYIAKLGDCAACHSAPGHAAYAGGLPINSPFGIIYSTNITPDAEAGIGKYSLDDFARAVRRGIDREGDHLYPAMTYPDFSMISDADIADLYAYFMKGVAPASERPPKTKLSFPFNQRWGLAFWNFFFSHHQSFKPDSGHDDSWNRGAYLVESLGHCGSCHTPRNIAYEEKAYSDSSPDFLTGYVMDNWHATGLRGNPASGLGRWSDADIEAFLKTGQGHGAAAFGGMTQVIEDSTQYMTDGDRRSIAHYLKSLSMEKETASYDPAKVPAAVASYPVEYPGAGLYASGCAGCHGASGTGKPGVAPALAGNPSVLAADSTSLVHILLDGGMTARTADQRPPNKMPAFSHWTDRELGEVLSYIRLSWGNKADAVTMRDISSLRATLENRDKAIQKAARQEPVDKK